MEEIPRPGFQHVWLHVGSAGGVEWGYEVEVFVRGTGDGCAGYGGGEHAANKIGEWREAVHEDPEAGHGCGSGEYTGERETR